MSGWVRLWHEMPTDPKWRVIARRSGQSISEVIAVFTFVMVNASANASERGRTHNLVCDDIAAALDMEEEAVEAIMVAMLGKVLDDDGRLLGWEKRQPKREDSSAERAKAWREERKRTQANASKRPDIEIEIEIDTEIEIEPEAKASVSKKRAHRLPADWMPGPLSGQIASDVAEWPAGAMGRELERFKDWGASASGANATKTDWQAAWRNWLRKAHDEGRYRKNERFSQQRKPTTLQTGWMVAAEFEADESERGSGNPDLLLSFSPSSRHDGG